MLLTNGLNSPYDDKVGLAIYSADKYDSEGNEIAYDYKSFQKTTSITNPLTAVTSSGLTLDDIIFPANVYGKEINVGIFNRARQDTSTSSYANKATLGMFELQDKEIKSIQFMSDGTRGDDNIAGIIPLPSGSYGSGALKSAPSALIPVELPADKADSSKVYFAYVGRIANSGAVLAATLSFDTLQEKIDAVNAVLTALDSKTLTESQIAAYRAQIAAVKAESEYILDSDFDISKLTEAENRIEEERIEAIRQRVAALNETLKALDSNTLTEEDIASYKAQIVELKAEADFITEWAKKKYLVENYTYYW